MDATPVTLGQEFTGYAAQVQYGIERLRRRCPGWRSCRSAAPLSGTGVNAPPGLRRRGRRASCAAPTGLPLTEARNHFEAQGARDALVEASGQLRVDRGRALQDRQRHPVDGVGPAGRAGRAAHPRPAAGSSIMPGKVNPVVCESVRQVCAQVIGNDAAVAFAGSQGDFELNVMLPVMARNLLESIRLLAAACRLLADRCVAGLDRQRRRRTRVRRGLPGDRHAAQPLPRLRGGGGGREAGARRGPDDPRGRHRTGSRGGGRLTEAQLDEALDVLRMTRPNEPM